jgi:hypothetical protein
MGLLGAWILIVCLNALFDEGSSECPKCITIRQLVPFPRASPKVVHKRPTLSKDDRLAEDAISFILSSDTVFLGITYSTFPNDTRVYPSRVGMNHRGGRPGFILVRPSDGRTIVLPDFSGNRIMSSVGTSKPPPASLTFVNFTTGDILYVTGNATNLVGPESQAIMPFQNTLTTVYVTGYTLILNALPCREDPASNIQPNPYSPPIRFLAEEKPPSLFDTSKTLMATLLCTAPLSPHSLGESSKELAINPGHNASFWTLPPSSGRGNISTWLRHAQARLTTILLKCGLFRLLRRSARRECSP